LQRRDISKNHTKQKRKSGEQRGKRGVSKKKGFFGKEVEPHKEKRRIRGGYFGLKSELQDAKKGGREIEKKIPIMP